MPTWRAVVSGPGWMLAAAAAVMAGARWLRGSEVEYLVIAAAATVAAGVLALLLPSRARAWAIASASVAAVFCVIAGTAQRTLATIESNWPAYRVEVARDGSA
ncbi:MAG TPA: hypothetical protein VF166_10005, partial [Gemmatimonadaceae bacterium]